MTDFTDFVLRVGAPKVSKVAEIQSRPAYNPAVDFWKQMRTHINSYHLSRVSELSLTGTGASEKKKDSYKKAILGYKKFLNQQAWEWFSPGKATWASGELAVNVNPEVGLLIAGKKVLIKLYFKQDTLTKARFGVALAIMRESYSKNHEVAILDVRRSRLHTAGKTAPTMHALLVGEAATFISLWQAVASGD